MSDEWMCFELLEDEASNTNSEARLQRRLMRDRSDPFGLDNVQFIKRYRLTKELVHHLCDELRPHLSEPTKSTDLPLEVKVLITLSFYATGSYQRPIGDIAAHSVAQPTVSTVISQITKCLNLPHIRAKYIKFPQNAGDRRANLLKFYNKFGMPGVLGCIDCTHVGIVRPKEYEERFYGRKQYHSLNVQLICNADMEIISVDASHGGATHDSFIWNNHPLKAHMEEISQNNAIWLLGDSGYPQRKTMMTPIVDAAPGSPEAHYTELHVRARNTIERSIGLLKARFRCLLVHRILHYSPPVAANIVNACVILHNICNRANVDVQELSEEDASREVQMQLESSAHHSQASRSSNNELNEGVAARRELVNRLWTSRVN